MATGELNPGYLTNGWEPTADQSTPTITPPAPKTNVPISKEPINVVYIMKYLALNDASSGENDLAFERIENFLQHPTDLSYGLLKLHPYWDSLRGDPRFEEIVASLAPKDAQP